MYPTTTVLLSYYSTALWLFYYRTLCSGPQNGVIFRFGGVLHHFPLIHMYRSPPPRLSGQVWGGGWPFSWSSDQNSEWKSEWWGQMSGLLFNWTSEGAGVCVIEWLVIQRVNNWLRKTWSFLRFRWIYRCLGRSYWYECTLASHEWINEGFVVHSIYSSYLNNNI